MFIQHTVIPAAGYGTRLLPYTKSVCKEMLPLIDKPLIHHIVEEAADSGCMTAHIVINERKEALRNYFNEDKTLTRFLEEHNKVGMLQPIRDLAKRIQLIFAYQHEQVGTGDALLQALGDVPRKSFFSIMYPDDILFSSKPVVGQLSDVAQVQKATVIAIMQVPRDKVSCYGIVEPAEWISDTVCRIGRIIEKPSPEATSSSWAVVGRYVVSPGIVQSMYYCKDRDGKQFLFTDALNHLASYEPVYAYVFHGIRYDTGTPEGWLAAVIDYALHNRNYAGVVRASWNNYR